MARDSSDLICRIIVSASGNNSVDFSAKALITSMLLSKICRVAASASGKISGGNLSAQALRTVMR